MAPDQNFGLEHGESGVVAVRLWSSGEWTRNPNPNGTCGSYMANIRSQVVGPLSLVVCC